MIFIICGAVLIVLYLAGGLIIQNIIDRKTGIDRAMLSVRYDENFKEAQTTWIDRPTNKIHILRTYCYKGTKYISTYNGTKIEEHKSGISNKHQLKLAHIEFRERMIKRRRIQHFFLLLERRFPFLNDRFTRNFKIKSEGWKEKTS
jgi:hypothetical protein